MLLQQVPLHQRLLAVVALVNEGEFLERPPGRLPAASRRSPPPGRTRLARARVARGGAVGELDDAERRVVHVPRQPVMSALQIGLRHLARRHVAEDDLDDEPAIHEHRGGGGLDREGVPSSRR